MKKIDRKRGFRILARLTVWVLLASGLTRLHGQSETVTLNPVQDATIFENAPDNAYGDGYLNAGRTSGGTNGFALRRALIKFDVASAVPSGATIESVNLTLHAIKAPTASPPEVTSNLFRLTTDWSEGSSGGLGTDISSGVPASPGDCTWNAAEVIPGGSGRSWSLPGGDFVDSPSATISYSITSVTLVTPLAVSWSTPAMAADVQGWVDDASSNHGWMLQNEENGSKLFYGSRETDPVLAPTLEITYSARPAGDGDALDDAWERAIVDAFADDGVDSIEDVLPEADFNGDGLPNVLAYALGFGPTEWVGRAASGYPAIAESEGDFLLRFTALDAAASGGIRFVVEASQDLTPADSWQEIARYDSNGWTLQGMASATAFASGAGATTWDVLSGEIRSTEFYRLTVEYE